MSDDRPRPEYGEYATPEQQAAAMGKTYSPPPPVGAVPVILPATSGAASSQPDQERLQPAGNVIDRFATIFQLGIGLVFLVNSNFFQFAEASNAAASELGFGKTIPTSFDRLGWLLLTVNIVLYLGTAVWAYSRLRRAKLAFFVPIIGIAVFYAFLATLLTVVLYG